MSYILNCQYVEPEKYSGNIIINVKLKMKSIFFIKKRYDDVPYQLIDISVLALQI